MNLKLEHNFEFREHKDVWDRDSFDVLGDYSFPIELVIKKNSDLFLVVPSNALKCSM